MPKLTGRLIDYSQEEMLKMTGLERHKFRRDLARVCEMYDFDINCLKVEKGNKNSEYFLIPEVADLITILLRNLDKHPPKRTNAKIDDITRTEIRDYYESVLTDIDEAVRPSVAETIYCLESHLVAQNTVDWTERFAKQLTRFLVNITTLKEQDIGASLKLFTQKLDEMNYYLYRGAYALSMARDSNFGELQKLGMTDDSCSEEINKKTAP